MPQMAQMAQMAQMNGGVAEWEDCIPWMMSAAHGFPVQPPWHLRSSASSVVP